MLTVRFYQISLALLSWAIVLVPAPLLYGAPRTTHAGSQVTVVDTSLNAEGALTGQVVDRNGVGVSGAVIALHRAGSPAIPVKAGQQGEFYLTNFRGGEYTLVAGSRVVVARVWSKQAAPPMAGEKLMIVAGGDETRGQEPLGWNMKNPLIWYGIILGAVSIPIIVNQLDNDRDDAS